MKTRKRLLEIKEGKTKLQVELLSLYQACMNNAYKLIKESELLFSNTHFERAFFLAFTSYEEVGKGQVTADYFSGCVSKEEFEKAFKDHNLKIAYNSRCIALSTENNDAFIEYNIDDVKSFSNARANALYVAYDEGFKPIKPDDVINKKHAEEMIDHVKEELEFIEYAEWLNDRIGSKALFK